MGVLVEDSLTDVAGTLLEDHVPDVAGTGYNRHPTTLTDTAQFAADGARVRRSGNSGSPYYMTDEMASPDQTVEVEWALASSGAAVPVLARLDPVVATMYLIEYAHSTNTTFIRKRVLGAQTNVVTTTSWVATLGTYYDFKFECFDRWKRLYIDGALVLESGTNEIPGDNTRAGVMFTTGNSDVTGMQVASFKLTDHPQRAPDVSGAVDSTRELTSGERLVTV